MDKKLFYRAYVSIVESGYTHREYTIRYHVFQEVKETKSGYWIKDLNFTVKVMFDSSSKPRLYGDPKFIYKNARNSFAYDTKEKALYNYKLRNKKRLGFLERDINITKGILESIKQVEDVNK